MPLFNGLAQRHLEHEIMDQPDLEPSRHHHALRGLERINCWSGSVRILWPAIKAYARRRGLHSLKILDIACGAGDLPIGLWLAGRREKFSLRIEAWDISPLAVEHARTQAVAKNAEIVFSKKNALEDSIPADFDIITCSLFLHHLTEVQAIQLLKKMDRAAQGMILVNDLIRGRRGLLLAWLGTRLLTTSHVVHVDGPRSVRAAYTVAEARQLATQAGLAKISITHHWPYRFLLLA